MSFSSRVNNFFRGIKRKVSGWSGRNARAVQEEQQPAIQAPAFNGSSAMPTMGRGLLTGNTFRSIPGYNEASDNPEVIVLVSVADEISGKLSSLTIPPKSEHTTMFLKQAAAVNAEAAGYLEYLKNTLIMAVEGLANDSEVGARFAGAIGGYAMLIQQQIEFNTRILDVIYEQARSGNDAGVPYGRNYADLLQDQAVTQITREDSYGDRELVGSGALNSVYKMQDTVAGRERVFKKGHKQSTAIENDAVGSRLMVEKVGSEGFDMHSGNRDVAVSMIDRLFGLNAVVTTSMSKSAEGNNSSMMDLAKGKDGKKTTVVFSDKEEKGARIVSQLMDASAMLADSSMSTEKAKRIEKGEKSVAHNIVRGDNVQFLSSAYAMAALDIIVGHVDRHRGNMMVSADGVKGIDNDTSFSLRDVFDEGTDAAIGNGASFQEIMHDESRRRELNKQNGVSITNEMGGIPILFFNTAFPKVPIEFATKICSISSADIRNTLQSLLTKPEIEACVKRTEKLQKYFRSLEGTDRLVAGWEDIDIEKYTESTIVRNYSTADAAGNYMGQMAAHGIMGVFHGDVWDNLENDFMAEEWIAFTEYINKKFDVGNMNASKVFAGAAIYVLMNEGPDDFSIQQMLIDGTIDTYIWYGASQYLEHGIVPNYLREAYNIIGVTVSSEDIIATAEKNKAARIASGTDSVAKREANKPIKPLEDAKPTKNTEPPRLMKMVDSVKEDEKAAEEPPKVTLGRGVINGDTFRRVPGYESVKNNALVVSLIQQGDQIESILESIKIPDKNDDTTAFVKAVAEGNAAVQTALDIYIDALVDATTFLAKNPKEEARNFAAGIGGFAMQLNQQKEFTLRIMDLVFELSRSGGEVPYGRSYKEALQDVSLTQIHRFNSIADAEVFGHGAINSVLKVKDSTNGRERIYKGGHKMSTSAESIAVGARLLIKEVKGSDSFDMHSGHRDVALSMIDRLFGLNAAVTTSFAKSEEGDMSSMMDKAEGVEGYLSLLAYDEESMREIDVCKQIMLHSDSIINKEKPDSEKNRNIRKKRAGALAINAFNPKFIESMMNLQALDIITGHIDRHTGNYLVTADGVKGIDNDTSFSLRDVADEDTSKAIADGKITFAELASRGDKVLNQEKGHTVTANNTPQMFFSTTFPKVTQSFINKICSVSSGDIRNTLMGLLSVEEIDACILRTQKLQKYLKSLEGSDKIIRDWMEFDSKSYIQKNMNIGFNGSEDTSGNQMAQLASSGYLALFYRTDFWRGLDLTIPSSNLTPQGVLGDYVKRICPMDDASAARIGSATIYNMTHTTRDLPTISELVSSGQLENYLRDGARELMRHSVKPVTIRNCAQFIGEPLDDKQVGEKVKANMKLREASTAAGVNL